jgi:hypothetical protein
MGGWLVECTFLLEVRPMHMKPPSLFVLQSRELRETKRQKLAVEIEAQALANKVTQLQAEIVRGMEERQRLHVELAKLRGVYK